MLPGYISAVTTMLSGRMDFAQFVKVMRLPKTISFTHLGKWSIRRRSQSWESRYPAHLHKPRGTPKSHPTNGIRRLTRLMMGCARSGKISGLRTANISSTTIFAGFTDDPRHAAMETGIADRV